MAEKFRPQYTLVELNCILAALDYTVQSLEDAGVLILTAPDGTELPFIEMHKTLQKVAMFKAKIDIGLNLPAYTAGRAKAGRPSNQDIAAQALGVKNSKTMNEGDGKELGKDAVAYTKYIQGHELEDAEKVWAINYKLANDKENVTEEENAFYIANVWRTM